MIFKYWRKGNKTKAKGVIMMWESAMRLRSAGKHEEALKQFEKITVENPQDAEAQYYVAATNDVLGREKEAVPYYEKAIALGYDEVDAYIGLGSTYRVLHRYEDARKILEQGYEQFPDNFALPPFLAMTYYNLQEHEKATTLLLQCYVKASLDNDVQAFSRAINYYATHLND